ncbi:MAG: hypothetical protein V3V08_12995 [Nannocystaceae bacterium]
MTGALRGDPQRKSQHRAGRPITWWFWYIAPYLLALTAFASGLGGDFVLDDQLAIVDNPVVRSDVPLSQAFHRTFWGRPLHVPPGSYRPIASLSFRLDHAIYDLWSPGFHITSLCLYMLTLFLGQRLAACWLSHEASGLAMCAFAGMPLHVENVSSLVGRADTLALLFTLSSALLWFPQGRPTRGGLRLGMGAMCLIGALLSKESAITWPAVTLLLTVPLLSGPRSKDGSVFRLLLPCAAASAASGCYLAFRFWLLPDTLRLEYIQDDLLAGAKPWSRATFALENLGEYLRLVVAPVDLCTGRKYATVALSESPATIMTLVGALSMLLVAWRLRCAWNQKTVPWTACAIVSWILFSHLFVSMPEAMADRFMLTPTYFLCVAVGRWCHRHASSSRIFLPSFGLVVWLQTAASIFYASRWADTDTLLQHSIVACPDSAHNQFRYARRLADRGYLDEAIWHFAVASQIRHHFPRKWRHPAVEEESQLPAASRVRRMHLLLGVALPETAWRAAFIRLMLSLGYEAVAQRISETSPVTTRTMGR